MTTPYSLLIRSAGQSAVNSMPSSCSTSRAFFSSASVQGRSPFSFRLMYVLADLFFGHIFSAITLALTDRLFLRKSLAFMSANIGKENCTKKVLQIFVDVKLLLYICVMIKFLIKTKGFSLRLVIRAKAVKKLLKWIIF